MYGRSSLTAQAEPAETLPSWRTDKSTTYERPRKHRTTLPIFRA